MVVLLVGVVDIDRQSRYTGKYHTNMTHFSVLAMNDQVKMIKTVIKGNL